MQIEIGSVYDGTVTGLTNFGAFVKLSDGTTGLVHISEVAAVFLSIFPREIRLRSRLWI